MDINKELEKIGLLLEIKEKPREDTRDSEVFVHENKDHNHFLEFQKRINRKVLSELMALGLSEGLAKIVIRAIAHGKITNVKINY